jgi:hypothetical protein
MYIVKIKILFKHLARSTRRAISGPDSAQDLIASVPLPVDGTVSFPEGGMASSPDIRSRIIQRFRLRATRRNLVNGFENACHGGLSRLIPVKASLGSLSHGEAAGSPDISGIKDGIRLKDGYAPLPIAAQHGPVQG